jgi:hypothetical protein
MPLHRGRASSRPILTNQVNNAFVEALGASFLKGKEKWIAYGVKVGTLRKKMQARQTLGWFICLQPLLPE